MGHCDNEVLDQAVSRRHHVFPLLQLISKFNWFGSKSKEKSSKFLKILSLDINDLELGNFPGFEVLHRTDHIVNAGTLSHFSCPFASIVPRHKAHLIRVGQALEVTGDEITLKFDIARIRHLKFILKTVARSIDN